MHLDTLAANRSCTMRSRRNKNRRARFGKCCSHVAVDFQFYVFTGDGRDGGESHAGAGGARRWNNIWPFAVPSIFIK